MPILKTRLHKPPVEDSFILRDRLMDRLDDGVHKRLVLVVGGAGYGKSVLVSQWLEKNPQKYCWVSLETDCNDLQIFLSYLITGIQQEYPHSMSGIAQLVQSNYLPPTKVIAELLSNDLAERQEGISIIMDDLHKVGSQVFYELLNQLLPILPGNVRLILISRIDPPLKKARIQAYNQVCEIRMADLRMDSSEIMAMAKKKALASVTDEKAGWIEKETEGWALGINLVLREYTHNDPDSALKPSEKRINNANVLFEFIRQDMDPEHLQVLMVASLFERFNLELLEQFFEHTNSFQSKTKLKEGFQFLQNRSATYHLIALDANNKWYRLHHLIEEILRNRFIQLYGAEEIETLYRLAGAYFGGAGFPEEGIRYALIGKKEELAVQIIESNWDHLTDHGENLRLLRWINMMPAGVRNTDPTLLVIRAYLCDTIYFDYDAMGNLLEIASKHLEARSGNNRFMGAFTAVHSCFSFHTGDFAQAIKFANQALDTLEPDQALLQDYARHYKVMAASLTQVPSEVKSLIDSLERNSGLTEDHHFMRWNVTKLFFHWHHANLENLKEPGKIVTEICKQAKDWWMFKMGCYYLSQYHYLKNQISKVYPHIDAGIDCLFNAGPVWTLQLYYGGILAALAENDAQKAQKYLKAAKEFVDQDGLESFKGYLRAFEVELALRANDIETAWKLDDSAKYFMHPPIKYYYIPQFTRVKLFVRMGDPLLIKEASALIRQYKKDCERNPYAQIQIILLEAEWYVQSGLNERAVDALRDALDITPDDHYIRVFLDMGELVKKLIAELPEDQKQTSLVRNILMAYRHDQDLHAVHFETDHLTSREVDIMKLVSRGLKNKEIADKLCLSEATIKTYLYKIYQKLGVKNRTGAIKRLKELETP